MRIRELSEKCIKAGISVCTAESCTGGLIAEKCTAAAGASAWFCGGVVSYLESVKTGVLKIPKKIISVHGVVSAEVAEAMAENVRKLIGADIAVSVTGYAGPDGGDAENEVGTVYLGISSGFSTFSVRKFIKGDRSQVRLGAAAAAIELMCEEADKFLRLRDESRNASCRRTMK